MSNISTNTQSVINMRKKNPCATLQAIGDKYGITRERVRQILDAVSLPTRHYVKRTLYTCLQCGNITRHKSGICSRECKSLYVKIPLVCSNCGVKFLRYQSVIIAQSKNVTYKGVYNFCSNKCRDEYNLKHHFFAYRPARKYDWELIENLYLQNYTYKDISELTNTPITTLGNIILELRRRKGINRPHFRRYSKRTIIE